MSLRRPGIQAMCVAAVTVAVMGARVPIAARQLWAEDGSVFLQDALERGPISPFGSSYAGYFHFVPRAIAAMTSFVPIRWAAGANWLLVTMVVGWCAATIFLDGRAWLQSTWARVTLAVSLVLLPSVGVESLANSANLFLTLLFASLIVLTAEQRRPAAIVSGAVLVFVTGLSTPLSGLLAPIACWRVATKRRMDWITGAWLTGVVAQWMLIMFVGSRRESVSAIDIVPSSYVRATGGPVLLVLALVLIGAGFVMARGHGSRRLAALLVLVPATGGAVLTFTAAHSLTHAIPARHWLVPAWCLLWAALVSIEHLAQLGDATIVKAACAVLVVVWLAGWSPAPARRIGQSWNTQIDSATHPCGERVVVPIMPATDPPRWFVEVDGDRLC